MKYKIIQSITLSLVIISGITMISCKKDKETSKTVKVNLSFIHKVGLEVLEFDTLKYTNAVGHNYEVRTLKYFISNITFSRSDGSKEIYKKPVYINAKDSSTLSYSNIEIPSGTYESIGITFGIDSEMNVSDTLTTVEEVSMAWPDGNMGGGYHYLKLEGTYDSLGVDSINKNYNIHTGGIMGHPHDFNVTFQNSAFTVNEKGLSFKIIMDVNEWFTNPDNYDFADYGHMIMMDMTAQMQLRANGSSVFSISVD
ncbi:MAG: hypothetical protein CMP63_07215 [Flavobacteriales bacterium]|nr:hypothetical protein [Flavobacteriales bacterium]|tara:strand:+ start:1936 stop:2697 length:762 start_codon:yes stop_codon:yes gene_type:complete